MDEVWHLHLTYTRNYWEGLCEEILGRKLHHNPSQGGPEEGLKHRLWYADTLDQYRRTFGIEPDKTIWPASAVPADIPKKGILPEALSKMAPRLLPVVMLLVLCLGLSGCLGPDSVLFPFFLVGAFTFLLLKSIFYVASQNPSSGTRDNTDGGSSGCGGGGCGGGGCGGGGCGGGCGG